MAIVLLKAAASQHQVSAVMTSVPFLVENEPIGIVLRTGQPFARPAVIWAYCWCADEAEDGLRPHQRLPIDPMAQS